VAEHQTEQATLTKRDLGLIEVALDAAVNSVRHGATLSNGRGLDPLTAEYLTALDRIEKMRASLCRCRVSGAQSAGVLWRAIATAA
jgi:hypothetical protein